MPPRPRRSPDRSTDEQRRLAALQARGVLDTPTEPAFDDLAALARDLCRVPVAGVAFLDRERNWFKAMVGSDLRESPREESFCRVVVERRAPVAVPDLPADPEFTAHPLVVGPPHLRAYAGAPVVLDDEVLGTVCVFDVRARPFSRAQVEGLAALARLAAVALTARTVRAPSMLAARLGTGGPDAADAGAAALDRITRVIDLDGPPPSVAVSRRARRG